MPVSTLTSACTLTITLQQLTNRLKSNVPPQEFMKVHSRFSPFSFFLFFCLSRHKLWGKKAQHQAVANNNLFILSAEQPAFTQTAPWGENDAISLFSASQLSTGKTESCVYWQLYSLSRRCMNMWRFRINTYLHDVNILNFWKIKIQMFQDVFDQEALWGTECVTFKWPKLSQDSLHSSNENNLTVNNTDRGPKNDTSAPFNKLN